MYKWTKFLVIALCALQVNLYVWTAQSQVEDVLEFIKRRPIDPDRYYMEKVRSFTSADCDKVVPLLRNLEYEKYWRNILNLVGINGNESHVEALLAFREKGSGKAEISRVEYLARQGVITTLGYLGSRGIESAVEELIEMAEKNQVPENMRDFQDPADLSFDIVASTKTTIIAALASTGSLKAERQLEFLKIQNQENPNLLERIDRALKDVKRYRSESYLEEMEATTN